MWGYWDGHGWGGMGLGMLLFWSLVIGGIVMLVRCLSGAGEHGVGGRERSALDILKERYARGEIERDEFEQKKRDLAGR